MPVSLDLLVADKEPSFITEELLRSGAQFPRWDADLAAARRRDAPLSEATAIAVSFARVARIDHLRGLEALTSLRLDNNRIERVENLGHLVRGG